MTFQRFHPLRTTPAVREAQAEVHLAAEDFILPLFVLPGQGRKEEIPSLPGVFRLSPDRLTEVVSPALDRGVKMFLLFGVPDSYEKTDDGRGAFDPTGPVPRGLQILSRSFPQAVLFTDVCLCAYTLHGHCGVMNSDHTLNSDATLPLLAEMALAHARAGAHWVAPSAMMDGQVQAIRARLDQEGFSGVHILGYSAKFASRLYGPFRDAAASAPAWGDRRSYQMDPRTPSQALGEIQADLEEGAQAVMVKPAQWYQDILRQARDRHPQALLAAYQVSGEYMMILHGAAAGLFDLDQAYLESLIALKRAGADWIITYGAPRAAELLTRPAGDLL